MDRSQLINSVTTSSLAECSSSKSRMEKSKACSKMLRTRPTHKSSGIHALRFAMSVTTDSVAHSMTAKDNLVSQTRCRMDQQLLASMASMSSTPEELYKSYPEPSGLKL